MLRRRDRIMACSHHKSNLERSALLFYWAISLAQNWTENNCHLFNKAGHISYDPRRVLTVLKYSAFLEHVLTFRPLTLMLILNPYGTFTLLSFSSFTITHQLFVFMHLPFLNWNVVKLIGIKIYCVSRCD